MKCNCIEDLVHNAELRTHLEEKAGCPVGQLTLDQFSFNFRTGEARPFSTVSAIPVGKKRSVKAMIIHSFCSFCGRKYEPEETGADDVQDD